MNEERTYACMKCNYREYETKQISTTGGWVSRIFDFQSNRFTAFICARCGFVELYKGSRSSWGNIADILTSG